MEQGEQESTRPSEPKGKSVWSQFKRVFGKRQKLSPPKPIIISTTEDPHRTQEIPPIAPDVEALRNDLIKRVLETPGAQTSPLRESCQGFFAPEVPQTVIEVIPTPVLLKSQISCPEGKITVGAIATTPNALIFPEDIGDLWVVLEISNQPTEVWLLPPWKSISYGEIPKAPDEKISLTSPSLEKWTEFTNTVGKILGTRP